MNGNIFHYLLVKKDARHPDLDWDRVDLGDHFLFVGPDMPMYEHRQNDVRIVMLGFAFHIQDPIFSEKEIIHNIPLEESALLDYLDNLSGNFLFIISFANRLIMLNDAAAVLKMFYMWDNEKISGVASDPKILSKCFELLPHRDPAAAKFYESDFFKNTLIRLGDKTRYANVFQVLPNHMLNVTRSKVQRYFPRTYNEYKDPSVTISSVNKYFENIISAAVKRYDLKCSITAGWDSRMVLATTKNHKKDVEYYTFNTPRIDGKDPDIRIPKQIAESLDLSHEIIPVYKKLSTNNFEEIKNYFDLIPIKRAELIYGGFARFNRSNNLVLTGAVSEICKNYYDEVPVNTGEQLAKAAHYPATTYVLNHFETKLKELKKLSVQYGYNIKDLAHWEQDITNFAAQGMLYNSFAARTFSPFNNRTIIKTILGVPRQLRDKHHHKYYQMYLKECWPELNSFPVNPTLKKKLMVAGKKMGIYQVYKKISTRFRT